MHNAGKGSALRPSQVSKEEFSNNWDRIFGKKERGLTHVHSPMDESPYVVQKEGANPQIEINDRVIANRDGKAHQKGQTGTVSNLSLIDSEVYLFVALDPAPDGTRRTVGPSSETYWDKT